MKASYLTGIRRTQMREIPVPDVKDHEVLVKIRHCGVCGSDLHYYEHGRIGDFVVTGPLILGHECAGEVVGVGAKVKNLKEGDLVALEPGIACGECEYCRSGRYNLCPDVVFMATPPVDGAFREYLSYPASYCFKLPGGMDTVEGALLEPLNVGFHAAARAGAQVGQTAVILGGGCIGLCTLMALHARGVGGVYLFDLIDKRLKIAEELGAAGAYNAKHVDPVEKIYELTGGKGADVVFETAGAVQTTKQTAHLVRRGGVVVIVGQGGNASVEYDFGTVTAKEIDLRTIFRYRNLYPTVMEAVAGGKLPLKKIVSDVFRFDEVDKALEYCVTHKEDIVKAVIAF